MIIPKLISGILCVMNLSEMSVFFRKLVKWGGILLVLLIVGKLAWNEISAYWIRTHTPPPTPPNFALGNKIPKLQINLANTNFSATKITLDTIDGRLPKTTTVIPIYLVSKPTVTLLSFDRAQDIAKSLSFTSEPKVISETEFRWEDPTSNRTLNLKTTDFNFRLVQDNSNPKLAINFSEAAAIANVKNFLSQRNLLPVELSEGSASAKFVSIAGETIKNAPRSSANAVLVELFRQPIETKYPVLTKNAKESLVRAVVTLQKSTQSNVPVQTITEIKYTHWVIDPAKQGTYPVKPIELAWQEFKDNKSYSSIGSENYSELDVTDISLGYFSSEEYQEMIQPIFIFTGRGINKQGIREEFVSFLPAINTVSPVK